MLTPEAIIEFRKLYFKEYGVQLGDDHAYSYGTKLIGLIKLVYGSNIPKKWVTKVDKDKLKK